MKREDKIIIRKIKNGVMIEPFNNDGGMSDIDAEIIAFQNAEDFVKWIKGHFNVYLVPGWDDEKGNTDIDVGM